MVYKTSLVAPIKVGYRLEECMSPLDDSGATSSGNGDGATYSFLGDKIMLGEKKLFSD